MVAHRVPQSCLVFSREERLKQEVENCEIFTAAKLLDLLANIRALVERSNLTTGFLKLVKKQAEQKDFMAITN